MRRWLKSTALFITAFTMVLVLGAAALLIRLSLKPFSLGPFSDQAAIFINDLYPDFAVDFSRAALFWNRDENRLEITLSDVALTLLDGAGDENDAKLPSLIIYCEASALLQGQFRPLNIIIEEADVRIGWSAQKLDVLLRGESRAVDVAETLDENANDTGLDLEMPPLLKTVIDQLTDEVSSDAPFSSLVQLEIKSAHIELQERPSGVVWTIPDAALQFRRAGEAQLNIKGQGQIITKDQGPAGAISFEGRVFGKDGRRQFDANLTALRLPNLARGIDELAFFLGLEMPLSTDLHLDLSARPDRTLAIMLDLRAGSGALAIGPWYEAPRAFDELAASLLYDSKSRLLEVTGLSARFAQTELFLSGKVLPSRKGPPAINLKGGFSQLPVQDLVEYWPNDLASGARRWIAENMPKGRLHEGNLILNLGAADWQAESLSNEQFSLNFKFEKLEAHVLRPMPPILDASGEGTLSARDLMLQIKGGAADGLPVAGSQVHLYDFDQPGPQMASIALKVEAPLPDILRLIDYEPLGYTTAFGLEADRLKGDGQLVAQLDFPLVKELSLDDVEIDVQATVQKLAIPDLFAEKPLEDGNLDLHVDRNGLKVAGTARLGVADLDIIWREDFTAEDGSLSSDFTITSSFDRAILADLFFDPAPYFSGTGKAEIILQGRGPEIEKGQVALNLDDAILAVEPLGWHKPAEMAATSSFSIDFSDEDMIHFEQIRMQSPDGALSGSIDLAGDGRFLSADFPLWQMGETDISARLSLKDQAYILDIDGKSLDLRGLLKSLGARLGSPDRSSAQTADDQPIEAISFAFDLDELVTLDGISFYDLAISGRHDGQIVRALNLSAQTGDGEARNDEALYLRLMPADTGPADNKDGRSLVLSSGNAGRTLKGLGIFPNAEGGALDMRADLSIVEGNLAARGEARLSNVTLHQSQNETLSGDASSGLEDYIGPGGLVFNDMRVPFSLQNGIVDIDGASANGPRIGLTMEGQIDEQFDRININGVIVPAYRLNSFLGHIPLIGGLFTGGQGGGLFALSYRVKGRTSDLDISVNALTAIMPGILRKPFEGSKGRIEPDDPPKNEEEADPASESAEPPH
ncbi:MULTISPECIES: DUF3971 domain-containing protein [unclassified Iodidimonas]|uniref:YhdP family protein n=1 Tax=unclassified Iodidimonas TaxID=2626145 RepID=UPI0024830415|nr:MULTISPECIES: DUF3971 domain-containing protein [unclassified Iodidimonas]